MEGGQVDRQRAAASSHVVCLLTRHISTAYTPYQHCLHVISALLKRHIGTLAPFTAR